MFRKYLRILMVIFAKIANLRRYQSKIGTHHVLQMVIQRGVASVADASGSLFRSPLSSSAESACIKLAGELEVKLRNPLPFPSCKPALHGLYEDDVCK